MQSVRAFLELDSLWQQLVTDRYLHFVAEDMASPTPFSIRSWHRTEADPGWHLPKS